MFISKTAVLACTETESEIVFSLDLVLTPGHERYSPAKPDEQHCYCFGKLIFGNPATVRWLRKDFGHPSVDASGQIDFGAIDSMVLEKGVYRLAGAWGEVTIKSDPPTILLSSP